VGDGDSRGRFGTSPWWYGAATGLTAGGVALAAGIALLGYVHFASAVTDMARCAIPCRSTVSLGDPGTYVVFYEAPAASPADLRSLHVSIGGDGMRAEPAAGESSYSFGPDGAVPVERVVVTRGGSWRLSADGGPGGGQARLAIGRDPVPPFYRTGFVAVLAGSAPFALGVAIAAVTILERRRMRRRTIIPAQ
jgi:hypothetical protein